MPTIDPRSAFAFDSDPMLDVGEIKPPTPNSIEPMFSNELRFEY
jgi:hypothetical protein